MNPPQFIFTLLAIICWLPFRISSDHHQQLLNLIALQLVSSLSPANLSAICLLSRAHTHRQQQQQLEKSQRDKQTNLQSAGVDTVSGSGDGDLFVCLFRSSEEAEEGEGEEGLICSAAVSQAHQKEKSGQVQGFY